MMSGTQTYSPPTRIATWVTRRLIVYLLIALVVGQAFVGIAGLARGGEWVIAALCAELFCVSWIFLHRDRTQTYKRSSAQENAFTFAAEPQTTELQSPAVTEEAIPLVFIANEDIEARLVSLLEAAPEAGAAWVIRNRAGNVLGILLSQDEYELLNAAAAIARNPDRLQAVMSDPKRNLMSFEEVFGLGARG
jgi:hypothetical protein